MHYKPNINGAVSAALQNKNYPQAFFGVTDKGKSCTTKISPKTATKMPGVHNKPNVNGAISAALQNENYPEAFLRVTDKRKKVAS